MGQPWPKREYESTTTTNCLRIRLSVEVYAQVPLLKQLGTYGPIIMCILFAMS